MTNKIFDYSEISSLEYPESNETWYHIVVKNNMDFSKEEIQDKIFWDGTSDGFRFDLSNSFCKYIYL